MLDKVKIISNSNKFGLVEVNSGFELEKEKKSIVNKTWGLFLEEMEVANRNVFNGKLIRFEKIENNILYYSKGICYKEVIGLRNNPDINPSSLQNRENPNALSIFNIIIINNDKLIIKKRDSGDWSISYEVCGGFVLENEIEDICLASVNKLFQDYNIEKRNIKKQEIMFVYNYKKILETTLVFELKLDIEIDEIRIRNKDKEIILIDNNLESIDTFIQEQIKKPENAHMPSLVVLKEYALNQNTKY